MKTLSKAEYTSILMALIEFEWKFEKDKYIDNQSIKQLKDTIDTLRYYRQFAQ